MQFLEKEELPHFKFQKDFLMPFREVLANNPDVAIKDMVCVEGDSSPTRLLIVG